MYWILSNENQFLVTFLFCPRGRNIISKVYGSGMQIEGVPYSLNT